MTVLLSPRGLSPFFVSNPATLIIILLGTLGVSARLCGLLPKAAFSH